MGLYEYECKQGCGHFEKIKKWQEADTVKCPVCKGNAKRLFSVFGFSFGWRLTEKSHIRGNPDEYERAV